MCLINREKTKNSQPCEEHVGKYLTKWWVYQIKNKTSERQPASAKIKYQKYHFIMDRFAYSGSNQFNYWQEKHIKL